MPQSKTKFSTKILEVNYRSSKMLQYLSKIDFVADCLWIEYCLEIISQPSPLCPAEVPTPTLGTPALDHGLMS